MRSIAKSILLTAALVLAGCNTTRPLPTVKEDGDRAFRKGDFETANTNYQEYVERKPGEAEVQLSYAKTLLALNQPVEAVEHATLAYDQHPGDEDYINTLAQALFDAHHTDDLYRFLRGLTEGRGQIRDYIRLGEYSAKMGDADGAEHALLSAAQLDQGQHPEPQLALAKFYQSIGAKQRATIRYRMALYLDRNNPEITRALRDLGEVPGPSLSLKPEEAP